MIVQQVARIDIFQRAIVDIFERELGIRVIWGRSNLPRLPRPFARCMLLSGPTLPQLSHEHRDMAIESEYVVDFPAPSEGDLWAMRINGVPHRHTSAAGETADDLRDVFIASINADGEPVTASVAGPGQALVAESTPRGLWSIGASTGIDVAVSDDSTEHCVDLLHGRSDLTFSLQIVGADARVGTAGAAADLAAKALMVLDLDTTIDELSDLRLTLQHIAGPTDISGFDVTLKTHESRQSMDFIAGITTTYPQRIDVIETVEGTIETGATIPFEVTQ